MYYISMCVTPHWQQSNCQKVKKALAQFWVDAKDSVKACRKAINFSEQHQFEVHSIKQIPTALSEEDDTHDAIGFVHSQIAQEQGISMCLTNWDM